jgi:hypothetical protein
MAERFEVEIGDMVRIGKESRFVTIKEILPETVRIGKEDVVLKRLYFEEKHQPEFDWRIKEVKHATETTAETNTSREKGADND